MRIRIDLLLFGLPIFFSLDPDPDPTWNIAKNSWFIKSNLMPTYLKWEYIFFISNKVGSRSEFFSSAEPDPDPRNFFWILIPGLNVLYLFSKIDADGGLGGRGEASGTEAERETCFT